MMASDRFSLLHGAVSRRSTAPHRRAASPFITSAGARDTNDQRLIHLRDMPPSVADIKRAVHARRAYFLANVTTLTMARLSARPSPSPRISFHEEGAVTGSGSPRRETRDDRRRRRPSRWMLSDDGARASRRRDGNARPPASRTRPPRRSEKRGTATHF